MGFFDAIARNQFKTAKDGRQLYFPWGYMGRGYIIPSEKHYQRLRKNVKISIACIFIYLLVSSLLKVRYELRFVGIVPFLLWNYYQYRHLERTDERLTLNEFICKQAREFSFFVHWLFEIVAIIFVALGIFIIINDWTNWRNLLFGSASIVFFGFCAFLGAKIIIVKRRQENRTS